MFVLPLYWLAEAREDEDYRRGRGVDSTRQGTSRAHYGGAAAGAPRQGPEIEFYYIDDGNSGFSQ